MALKATKPKAVDKRLKMFLFGGPGAGKTVASVSFPNGYIIDCERGCDHYKGIIDKSDGVLLQTNDIDEVIAEVKALSTDKHQHRTLVIDPITTLESDLVAKAEAEFGAGDMRIWARRDKMMRRLMNLITSLDMNVILTSHSKIEYGPNMTKLGTTNDSWKRLPYTFDLVIEIEKRGAKRVAMVRKTRLEGFPDGDSFDFSYEEIARRYGEQIVTREAVPVSIASPEQADRLQRLIEAVKLEPGTVERWLTKAGVDAIEDMPAELVEKCIVFVENKINPKESEKK